MKTKNMKISHPTTILFGIIIAVTVLLLFSLTACDPDTRQFVSFNSLEELQTTLSGDDFYYFEYDNLDIAVGTTHAGEEYYRVSFSATKRQRTGDWLFSYSIHIHINNPNNNESQYQYYQFHIHSTHHTRPFTENGSLLKSISFDGIFCNLYQSNQFNNRLFLAFEIEDYVYRFVLQGFQHSIDDEIDYFLSLVEPIILSRYKVN